MEDSSNRPPICHAEPLTMDPAGYGSPSFPDAGQSHFGFHLLAELGRGAFGRVFLAKQESLAHRLVVLKVGSDLSDESRKLARLQHPNIVPVYSFHRQGPLQALCMPYLGPVTLAHLLEKVTGERVENRSGVSLTRVFAECQKSRHAFADIDGTIRNTKDKTKRDQPAAPPPLAEPLPSSEKEEGVPGFESLKNLSYVDATLMIVSRLADGLSRAHNAGIVHCDLKPANVLLSDDGRPMLLDFSVAFDLAGRSQMQTYIGGTLPYMSPEQIRSVQTRSPTFDGRSDVYGLGVILYELLAGRPPFGDDRDSSAQSVAKALETRLGPVPRLRDVNPAVSPAVESLVMHCLEADPARRYQSARELHEDLTRQLASRPLRYAPNPSAAERIRKWTRRNRVALAACLVVGVAASSVAAYSSRDALRSRRLGELESDRLAASRADGFVQDSRQARFALALAAVDPARRAGGMKAAERALARYGAGGDDRWWQASTALPASRQAQVREAVSSLHWNVAASLLAQARRAAGEERAELLRQAGVSNRRAELTHPGAQAPRPIWSQRAAIARLLGDEAAARQAADLAVAAPLTTSRDLLSEGRQLLADRKPKEALALIEKAAAADAAGFWPRYYLGVCHQALGQEVQAEAAFDVCVSLEPGFVGSYYGRGLSRLRSQDFARAVADFDRVAEECPRVGEVFVNRALAREGLKQYPEAIADLSRALELGYSPVMTYLVRARVYAAMKDLDAARRDQAHGLELTPTDELGWVARGRARAAKDLQGALSDFDEALKLNPQSLKAMQNKAHVLGRLGRNQQAAEVLSDLLELYPHYVDAWSGRGVLHARLNNRRAAVDDAAEALRRSAAPPTRYQAAGIYAMTSQWHPEDRDEAFRLLSLSLRAGFGFDLLAIDRELDPIRTDPRFKQVVEEARAYLAEKAGTRGSAN
jgi:serine/threonine protein kinase/Tfp pilus assembly protein PilF